MRKIKDRIMLGLVAGLAGTLVKSGLNLIAMKLGWTKADYATAAGGLFTRKKEAQSVQGQVSGRLVDLTLGGLLGLAATYLFTRTGKDRYLLKGALLGNGVWLGSYAMLPQFGLASRKVMNPQTALLGLLEFAAGGLATAMAINLLGDESLFPLARTATETPRMSFNIGQYEEEPGKVKS